MKLPLYLLIALVAASFAAGCRQSAFDVEVARAEALMESDPDSALAIAKNLHPSGKKEEARAALVLLKARYKAYIPLTDDSLALLAANHFTGDDTLAAQAQFFLGDTYFNQGRYDRALLAAKTGQDIADRIGDNYYSGLINRLQADVYECCYDYQNEMRYRKLAIEKFNKVNKKSHALWEQLSYIKALGNTRHKEESLLHLKSLAKDTLGIHNIDFHASFRRTEAMNYYRDSDYDKVITVYCDTHKVHVPMDSYDWGLIADSYTEMRDFAKASAAIDSANKYATELTDTLRIISAKRNMAQAQGEYEEAYKFYVKENSLSIPYQDSLLTHPFNSLIAENYQLQSDKAKDEAYKNHGLFVISTIIAFLFLIIASLIYILNKRSIQLKNIRIDKLAEELGLLEYTIKVEQDKIGEISSSRIALLERQIEIVNVLCSEIFRIPSFAKDTKKILKKFDGFIDGFRSQQNQRLLEEYLNLKYNGIVSILTSEYPSINDRQRMLFVFCAIGFSNEANTILMGMTSMNSLLPAKSRLKKYFLDANTEHTQMLITLLSSHKAGLEVI